jgi:hypothetical protein
MDWHDALTLPQLVGWGAFFLGVASFVQTSDLRFKQLMAMECAFYVLHFALLGQWTASASATISLGRSLAAVRYPGKVTGVLFMGLSVLCGVCFFSSWISWLPITASVLGTFALFFLKRVRMRLVMLAGTLCWLIHNAWVGSIGGTLLEAVLCVVNGVTLYRMWKWDRKGLA